MLDLQTCHLRCCDPPLQNIPRGDWYCYTCLTVPDLLDDKVIFTAKKAQRKKTTRIYPSDDEEDKGTLEVLAMVATMDESTVTSDDSDGNHVPQFLSKNRPATRKLSQLWKRKNG